MDNRRWLKEKGWGLFIHYLESLQNNPETPNNQGAGRTSWEECVNQLDVEDVYKRQCQDTASSFPPPAGPANREAARMG